MSIPDDYPDPDPNPAGVSMGGYQQLVRGEPFRGKFRKSFEKPEPFTPGKMDKVEFVLPDIYHTFRRGHRIMVQVQELVPPGGSQSAELCGYCECARCRFRESDAKGVPHVVDPSGSVG